MKLTQRENLFSLLQSAHTLWRNGKSEQAEELCRQSLQLSPDSPEANHLLGLILKQIRKPEEAEKYLKNSVALAPGNPEYKANLANFFLSSSRTSEAFDLYCEALKLKADFRPAQISLLKLLNVSDPIKSMQFAAEFLKGRPADPALWTLYGLALKSSGNMSDAKIAFKRAIELDPENGVAYHNLANLLIAMNHTEKAIPLYEKAAKLGVQGFEIEYNRANALIALNRISEGRTALQNALEINPYSSEAHSALVNLRHMLGEDSCFTDIEKALLKSPDNVSLWTVYGSLLRDAGEIKKSTDILKSAISKCGQKPELTSALAITLLEQGNFEEACDFAKDAASKKPENDAIISVLISTLLANENVEEAAPIISEMRLKRPENQELIAFEATAARLAQDPGYHHLNNYEKLVKTYQLKPPEEWESLEEFHRDLIIELESRHQFSAHPLNQSLRSGSQTAQSLLNDSSPIIQAFFRMLTNPLKEYMDTIGQDPDHPFLSRNHGAIRLSGCWSVRLKQRGFHVNHVHPQGWISSVYYVDVPPETSDAKNRNGWLKFGEPRYRIPGAEPEYFIEPKPGKLVLFPSYFWHGTTPIKGDYPRLTIAFDAINI